MRRSSKAGSQFATVLRDFATTTMSVVAATKASKMKRNGKLGKTNHLPLFVRHGELTSRKTRPDVSKDCNEVLDFYVFPGEAFKKLTNVCRSFRASQSNIRDKLEPR